MQAASRPLARAAWALREKRCFTSSEPASYRKMLFEFYGMEDAADIFNICYVAASKEDIMRALVQRVTQASVTVEGEVIGKIGKGFLVLLGVGHDDTEEQAQKLWAKISKMRIFEDENGKTNLSLADVEGEVLVVSQFTLYANCKKGNRPSFTDAGAPDEANRLYEYFAGLVRRDLGHVETGSFGALMQVALVNDGPFTVWLDTDVL